MTQDATYGSNFLEVAESAAIPFMLKEGFFGRFHLKSRHKRQGILHGSCISFLIYLHDSR